MVAKLPSRTHQIPANLRHVIASLNGILQTKQLDRAVVDVSGVGYAVAISSQTVAVLPDEGQSVSLFCHTHVREDALQLFGFATEQEREAFEALISVSGVGPRLALTILSGLDVDSLMQAIAEGQAARLRSIPGVGRKTAERLVVDLQDRCSKIVVIGRADPGQKPASPGYLDVVEALTNLGYKRGEAERAVKRVGDRESSPLPPEQMLRAALATIAEG